MAVGRSATDNQDASQGLQSSNKLLKLIHTHPALQVCLLLLSLGGKGLPGRSLQNSQLTVSTLDKHLQRLCILEAAGMLEDSRCSKHAGLQHARKLNNSHSGNSLNSVSASV